MTSQLESLDYEAVASQVMHDVFQTMLGFSLSSSAGHEYFTPPDLISSAVYFEGEWSGAALLECSESQACRFTEQLMNIPAPVSIDEDALDSMGEIINMIGGNLKSVLPPGVALSVPHVAIGTLRRQMNFPQISRFSYETEVGIIWLTLAHQHPN